ncbi:OST-HTH/LOTUS domain-containing protein [Burkholderia sp. PU8-34]
MHDVRDASSQFLTQILSVDSPELGARLKQRLKSAFVSSGLGVFDEKSLGFKKFSDYLLRAHGDLVNVERQEGLGDILVSLRGTPTARSFYLPTLTQPKALDGPVIRSDVWQAFANPDPERKRFFNSQTDKVVHYLDGQDSTERAQVEASHESFVEIPPISREAQERWMRDFLDGASLPPNEKEALGPLIAEPYSSTVNATFTRALGAHGVAWRKYRTAQVTSTIEAWASNAGVAISRLHVAPAPVTSSATQAGVTVESHATADLSFSPRSDQMPPRQQVLKLLELLTDDDISRLVLPTLLSTIMIRSRM